MVAPVEAHKHSQEHPHENSSGRTQADAIRSESAAIAFIRSNHDYGNAPTHAIRDIVEVILKSKSEAAHTLVLDILRTNKYPDWATDIVCRIPSRTIATDHEIRSAFVGLTSNPAFSLLAMERLSGALPGTNFINKLAKEKLIQFTSGMLLVDCSVAYDILHSDHSAQTKQLVIQYFDRCRQLNRSCEEPLRYLSQFNDPALRERFLYGLGRNSSGFALTGLLRIGDKRGLDFLAARPHILDFYSMARDIVTAVAKMNTTDSMELLCCIAAHAKSQKIQVQAFRSFITATGPCAHESARRCTGGRFAKPELFEALRSAATRAISQEPALKAPYLAFLRANGMSHYADNLTKASGLGLTLPYRFPPDILAHVIVGRTTNGIAVGQKIAAVILPVSDHNGVFAKRSQCQLLSTLIGHGYVLRVYEASTPTEWVNALKQATKIGKFDVLIGAGHGSRVSIQLGNSEKSDSSGSDNLRGIADDHLRKKSFRMRMIKDEITFSSYEYLKSNALDKLGQPGCKVILDSCLSASTKHEPQEHLLEQHGINISKFRNMESMFKSLFPQATIFASPISFSGFSEIQFDKNGKVTNLVIRDTKKPAVRL